jgi:hypothetical protein
MKPCRQTKGVPEPPRCDALKPENTDARYRADQERHDPASSCGLLGSAPV